MGKPWLQILPSLDSLIQWEAFILIWLFVILSFVFQKVFLKNLSDERTQILRHRFKNLGRQLIVLSLLFLSYYILNSFKDIEILFRLLPYIGLATVVGGCVTFIQICRIIVIQYLFLISEKTAVPLLLVNIITLVFALFIIGWLITAVFGVNVAPLLATSTVFSIILGLALQDTLGNLFAGISLQVDHTFEIGDWIEITQGGQKVLGQVKEITWRATVLVGLLDELISIPNRFMAQSQLNNWTRGSVPIARSQTFRVSYTADLNFVSKVLTQALMNVSVVRQSPKPLVLVSEASESWVTIKVIYYINDYGKFATTADVVIRECLGALNHAKISVAYPKLEIEPPHSLHH